MGYWHGCVCYTAAHYFKAHNILSYVRVLLFCYEHNIPSLLCLIPGGTKIWKKIETLIKQLHTDIIYSHDPAIDFILQKPPLSELMNFHANVTNV
jgi:hypothetical protein